MEKATFGAGCFWGVEQFFREVPGVIDAVSGYAGGKVDHPTYKQICTDKTGHAEVVEVTFDPSKVSYATLVDLFFKMHDPTQLNRQGPDFGTQYRSVIFAHSPEQEQIAKEEFEKAKASGRYKRPLVTRLEPAKPFWRAEEYHQRYFEKNGGSCHISYAEVQKASGSPL
jgi:peptide-methionine (S)-S-oxide reductase